MAFEFISQVLLPRLAAASVQSALFVAVIWALCKLLPRLSAAARAMLWWLIALQLLVGVLWSNPIALPVLPAAPVEQVIAQPARATSSNAMSRATLPGSSQSAMPTIAATSPGPSALEAVRWTTVLAVLWLLGVSFMLARTVRGYLSTRQLMRTALPCEDRNLLQALQLASEAHGLRRAPALGLSESIDSPQLVGPWRPMLLLPAHHPRTMHADELDMALTHELVHLQRGDLWWGLLPAAAQHVFFFHPIAHWAAREYAIAREAACDAAVLAGNRHCARDYGRLLVRLGVAPRPNAGLASASPTYRILKRRLSMLHTTSSTPRLTALAITVAVAILGVMPYRIVAAPADHAPPAPRQISAPVEAVAPVAAVAPVEVTPAVDSVAPVAPVTAASRTRTGARLAPLPPLPHVPPPPAAAPPPPPLPPVPAHAPLAPPAPPAPPVSGMTTHGIINLSRNTPQAYVLLQDNDSVVNGSPEDLVEARRLQKSGAPLLWFRKGQSRYVVRDPTWVARFRNAFSEVTQLGDAQAQMGDRQSVIGEKQAQIGQRQGELGMKQAELGAGYAHQTGNPARMVELNKKQAALDQQQAVLDKQQAELAKPLSELDRQQAVLNQKMQSAHTRAEQQAKKLIDEALASGAAWPIRG